MSAFSGSGISNMSDSWIEALPDLIWHRTQSLPCQIFHPVRRIDTDVCQMPGTSLNTIDYLRVVFFANSARLLRSIRSP